MRIAVFCDQLASREPAPAGVAAAAVAAAFGASLLRKTLEIRGVRPDLARAARELAGALRAAASADIAAVAAHPLEAAALQAAPLEAARSAAGALDLCREAAPLITGWLAADLRAAEELLRGAARAILACLEANLQRAPSAEIAREAAGLRERLQMINMQSP